MAGQAQQLGTLNHHMLRTPLLLPSALEDSSQASDGLSPQVSSHFSLHTSADKIVGVGTHSLVTSSTNDTIQSQPNHTNHTHTPQPQTLTNITQLINLTQNTQSTELTNMQTPPTHTDSSFTTTGLADSSEGSSEWSLSAGQSSEDTTPLDAITIQVSALAQQLQELRAHLHEVQESVAQLMPASTNKTDGILQNAKDNVNLTYWQDEENLEIKHSNNTQGSINADTLLASVEIFKVPQNRMEDVQGTKASENPTTSSSQQNLHEEATVVTCKCSTEDLQKAISDMQEVQKHQTDQLDLMAQNLTLLQNNNKSSSSSSSSSWGEYNQRIGEPEGVNTLMEDLMKLKEEMENELADRGATLIRGANTSYTSGSSSSMIPKHG